MLYQLCHHRNRTIPKHRHFDYLIGRLMLDFIHKLNKHSEDLQDIQQMKYLNKQMDGSHKDK
jgi:hypothetical protein